jgi:hypothetical protein
MAVKPALQPTGGLSYLTSKTSGGIWHLTMAGVRIDIRRVPFHVRLLRECIS